ncbi:MAG: outer membrane lipoprotein-sorting protein [SAR324 cluster bacterium]|nr:outer membrane lipoprotein-sorting protein [SAR324 cluster bacterium]
MKNIKWCFKVPAVLMLLLLPALHIPPSFAAELTAKDVMVKVDARDTGKTSIRESTMILIDRKNNQRVRQTKQFSKEYGDDTKAISFFLSPADVKNTSFLSYNWDDESKEDDSWLYLPALRKVKRIASSDKSGSFMGSDFTYADIEGVEIEDYDYAFVKGKEKEQVAGNPTWVIESRPKKDREKDVIKETGNIKAQLWIRKDNFMVVQGKFWVKKGKKIKYLTLSEIEKIDGIWTAKKMQMVTTKKGKVEHSTVLQSSKIVYNEPMEDEMFTTQRMERGL